MNAVLGKEVVIRVRNKIGVVFDIARTVAEKGVNIHALLGTVEGDDCTVRLDTDDNLRAVDALKLGNYQPTEETVLEMDVPNKPGMLESVTRKLAMENIDLHHIYATVGHGEEPCRLVLSTTDNEHAMVILNR